MFYVLMILLVNLTVTCSALEYIHSTFRMSVSSIIEQYDIFVMVTSVSYFLFVSEKLYFLHPVSSQNPFCHTDLTFTPCLFMVLMQLACIPLINFDICSHHDFISAEYIFHPHTRTRSAEVQRVEFLNAFLTFFFISRFSFNHNKTA